MKFKIGAKNSNHSQGCAAVILVIVVVLLCQARRELYLLCTHQSWFVGYSCMYNYSLPSQYLLCFSVQLMISSMDLLQLFPTMETKYGCVRYQRMMKMMVRASCLFCAPCCWGIFLLFLTSYPCLTPPSFFALYACSLLHTCTNNYSFNH